MLHQAPLFIYPKIAEIFMCLSNINYWNKCIKGLLHWYKKQEIYSYKNVHIADIKYKRKTRGISRI